MGSNPFTMRHEVMLVSYDDVIKNKDTYFLSRIISGEFGDKLNNFLDLSKYENNLNATISYLSLSKTKKNIFEYLAKGKFDYADLYNAMDIQFPNALIETPLFDMGASVSLMITQKFIDKIYIHTDIYSDEIMFDIESNLKSPKIQYITGDYAECMDLIGNITTFIVDDIDKVNIIKEKNKLDYTQILFPTYGYNYTISPDGKLRYKIDFENLIEQGHIFKFAAFIPFGTEETEGSVG